MVDRSQQNAARVVGVAYPLTLVISIAAFFRLYAPLLVANDLAASAHNIAAHEQAVRIYLTALLAYGVGVVVLLTALYVVLRRISPGVAIFATVCRAVYAVMWFIQCLDLLAALDAARGGGYLQALGPESSQAIASLRLAAGSDAYYVGLGFYGLGTVAFAYLWFKSRYVPGWLAVGGVLSSAFAGFCGFAYLLFPSFGAIVSVDWYEMPIALFELGISVSLLTKGLRSSELVKT